MQYCQSPIAGAREIRRLCDIRVPSDLTGSPLRAYTRGGERATSLSRLRLPSTDRQKSEEESWTKMARRDYVVLIAALLARSVLLSRELIIFFRVDVGYAIARRRV